MKRQFIVKCLFATLFAVAMFYSEGCRKGGSAAGVAGAATAIPVVTTQPTNATKNVGQKATFAVTATGGGLSYQWRKNSTNIPGATGSSYTTPTLVIGDNGNTYDVVVTNTLGNVTSTAATLTVNPAGFPSINTQPANRTVKEPATATFTVSASGTGLSYQWYRGAGTGTPVGLNSNSYTTPATTVAADDGAQFHVVITNISGSVDSALATLTVTNPNAPTITTQPSNITAPLGGTATFTVTAGGSGLTYQWFHGVTPVGTNSNTLTINPVTAGDAGTYTVQVSNAGGTVTSNPRTLTVTIPYSGNPIVPSSPTVTLDAKTGGTSASTTFTVTNTGGTPITLTVTGATWLSGSNYTYTIAGGATQTITVTANPTTAGAGTSVANLTLQNVGGLSQTVAVTINVGAQTAVANVASALLDANINTLVTLNGSSSTGATFYQWTQIAGPAVTLSNANTNTATFTAPANIPARSLKFQLAAMSALATPPAYATVTVTIYNDNANKTRLFVDPVGGNDANTASTNANSKGTPMKTLALAYLDANSTGVITTIYMAAGNDTFSGTISLRHNISIYGGFEATNWTRDVSVNTTTVTNTEVVSGSNSVAMSPNGQPVDNNDHIDGFTLVGGTGDFSMCLILQNNTNPIVENMTFVGGTANNGDCECIRVGSPAVPTIKNCKFTLGTSATGTGGYCIGVLVNSSGVASIDGCTFGGGNSVDEIQDVALTTNATTLTTITNSNFLGTGTCVMSYNTIFLRLAGVTLSKSIVKAGTSPVSSRAFYADFRGLTASTLTSTIDQCALYGGLGTVDGHAVMVRYDATSANALGGQALTLTNSYVFGGSSAAENVGVEGWDNNQTGFTNPIRLTINNCTIDAGSAGPDCTGIFAHGFQSPGVKISATNNILYTTRTGGSAGVDYVKLFAEATLQGINTPVVLRNNLFFIDTAFTGQAVYYYMKDSPANIEIAPPSSGGTLDLTSATSINAAITATSKGGNINLTTAQGVANTTVFFTTAPFDYHLKQTTNPAIDAGFNLGAGKLDIDGQARPSGSSFDIGADEN